MMFETGKGGATGAVAGDGGGVAATGSRPGGVGAGTVAPLVAAEMGADGGGGGMRV